jgi:hypothetical protein
MLIICYLLMAESSTSLTLLSRTSLLCIVFVLGTEMTHNNLNTKEKNNSIVTAAKVLLLATILVVAIGVSTTPLTALGSRLGGGEVADIDALDRRAPSVVSGDNIYLAWWTNNTENGNEEVMFRASTDGGATFSDKINLSNSTEADSWRVEIAGEGETVLVSWWETNQTSDTPVARISTDAGETFGPLLMLGANGTIGVTEEEGEEEGETVEEEAVGGADVAE